MQKGLRNLDTGKIKVHIINNDEWILGIISRKLLELRDPQIEIDRSGKPDPKADINYYINWQGFVTKPKTKFDMIWFSHLCGSDEIIALRKADLIVAKSKHGKKTLQELGFNPEKIRIFEGIGSATDFFKKINIGFAGRLCYKRRKGEDELWKLASVLDRRLFKFYLFGKDQTLKHFTEQLKTIADAELIKDDVDKFFNTIDYYLQSSYVEGGSMDIINAVNTGTPIISRAIGFFYDFNTAEDFVYETYQELQDYFLKIQEPKLAKIQQAEINTWDKFNTWHAELFKKINS